jgi:hypothetical protein
MATDLWPSNSRTVLRSTPPITDDIHLFNEKLREWETTTITIVRMERWTARLGTSDYSQKRELTCYRSLKTLHGSPACMRSSPSDEAA